MAVQKSKKSRSRIGMRRSHQRVKLPQLATDEQTGVQHVRHHLNSEGTYRGRLIVMPKQAKADAESDDLA